MASSKLVAKMTVFLDFTKNSDLSGKLGNYDMLLMTSYLDTIATDCRQTLPKCVSRINQQLRKTAFANIIGLENIGKKP